MSAHHLPATTVVTALMESTATRVSALKVWLVLLKLMCMGIKFRFSKNLIWNKTCKTLILGNILTTLFISSCCSREMCYSAKFPVTAGFKAITIFDSETHMEMTEVAGKRAAGASDNYTTDLSPGECKDWCRNDTMCVAAMWSSGYCFIYYNKPTLTTTSTGDSVFMKTAIASSGMLKNVRIFCYF